MVRKWGYVKAEIPESKLYRTPFQGTYGGAGGAAAEETLGGGFPQGRGLCLATMPPQLILLAAA